ncbi:protoporphyrinogen oxidase [Planococcus citri]|uniref:protoporphyrinogen oxidase n=1 Tax=Planococcus citri TaxID=170843 RepID=UPI0031F9D76A
MTVVILGGGIGGLSAAHYLLKNTKHKILLLEASSRLGGWIRSEKQDNGLIFEQGPRTLRPKGESGANTLNLIEDLKLSDQLKPILPSHAASKNRYVYVNGKLHALPSSFSAIFKKLPPFSKPLINALVHDYKSPIKRIDDESIYDFVERRFGKEIADYAISPLICGVCGGDAKRISVRFLMKDLFDKEQNYGYVLKGLLWQLFQKKQRYHRGDLAKKAQRKEKWSSYAFQNGMEVLPQTLAEEIEKSNVTVMKDSPVVKLSFKKKVISTEKEEIPFEHLISTIPSYTVGKLVRDEHYPMSKELLKIPYASIITVNLAYSKKLLNIDGFGFLVPPSEQLPILGIVFDSCYAPFEDWTVLTVMMGGHAFNSFFKDNCSEDYVLKTATKYVADILKIQSSPDVYKINVLRDCIPQQTIGHYHRVDSIESYAEFYNLPLYLVGTAYRGTGINDTILSAKNAAQSIAKLNQ